jgi:hypothetical protein
MAEREAASGDASETVNEGRSGAMGQMNQAVRKASGNIYLALS